MPKLRDFQKSDAAQVNALVLRAFAQFEDAYQEWPAFQAKIANMASLADVGEVVVVEVENRIVGAVAYLGLAAPKAECFRPQWPIMRLLVVDPGFRGQGIGRALVEECLLRAKRDGASVFALHTSEIMQVALPMYERMGFKWAGRAPAIHGVEYGIYVKKLES